MGISSATQRDQKLTAALAILPDGSPSKLTMAGDASNHRVSPACTKSCRFASPLVARRSTRVQLPSTISTCHASVFLALELLDDGTVAVLERVHHLLQEEPERSEIVFREDFASDMQRVFALAAELLQIAVRVTDSRANPLVWLIRSKMQHQWRAAMSILARVWTPCWLIGSLQCLVARREEERKKKRRARKTESKKDREERERPQCVNSKRLRVCVQDASVCTGRDQSSVA